MRAASTKKEKQETPVPAAAAPAPAPEPQETYDEEDTSEVDFNPTEAGHLDSLSRRAQWLEQRMATMDPYRGGARFDAQEYEALMWVFEELGAAYTPGPYYGAQFRPEELDQPPVRDYNAARLGVARRPAAAPAEEGTGYWTPGARPPATFARPIARAASAPARRYFPGGAE